MEVKNIKLINEFEMQIFFDNGLIHEINEAEFFESLILLVIKLIDKNFRYDTTENAYEIDSCVNFMYIIYKITVYSENIHNKKELYELLLEDEYSGNVEPFYFFNKPLRNYSEAAFPDFYTYYTGAYSNLGVLYKVFKNFVKKMNLKFSTNNKIIGEFLFIRNKILIHPEDNMILGDNFENFFFEMNKMDWHLSQEEGEDSKCMFHYYHKGQQYSVDLSKNYLRYVKEILLEFLFVLLENEYRAIDNTDFTIHKYFVE